MADDSLFIDKIQRTFEAADADLLTRAHAFSSKKACNGNSTGYKAANLLLAQDADAITIAGALLAPLLWQGLADSDAILERFGPLVAATIEGLSASFNPRAGTHPRQRGNIHVLLASMDGVPRRAILFITFRLLALEYATGSHEAAAREMARETLDLLVPIANRLSLGDLRRRLEDTCFRILDPAGYAYLKENVAPIQAEDDKCLEILLQGVHQLLENNGIAGRIQGRTKSLYAIHRKMTRTGKTLEEIMDRVGLRVIVASVPECYTVLGLLHTHFKPIPGTFDDYIGLPKDNGYQSLHTCVYPVREISHKPIEFQVRTELMHMEAEHGTAAHWRYKNEAAAVERDHQRAQWMKGLVRQHQQANSNEAFIELLHRQVFQDHLVVFGNGGRIVRLAEKATVRDYLTITNIEVPEGSVVKVNGQAAALDRLLRDGDSIEVLAGGVPAGPGAGKARDADSLFGRGARHPSGGNSNGTAPAGFPPFPDKSQENKHA
ncbi:MAG: bifunctional (p)ppGpp synthetase/guanosine-3',5'-bis(diphosphate) 3'-pyrophosphohydrolase [Deltaproteobacteria bacterium]|nr:bifunctional (p)ppGpp synthetase/guanosine-3',5'-bis(diphosphate) 3'-pyrophosphohydrolase [Deltaproteobacteria bacterium]